MKKKTIIMNIIFGLLYYILGVIGFFYSFLFIGLLGVIVEYSEVLFWICFLVLPSIILILPIILKVTLKKEFYKSILLSLISVVAYFALIFTISFSIERYMSKFTKEKWANNYNIRYLMLNDLEEKYNLVGMKKEEVEKILGKGEEHKNRIYYTIKSKLLRSFYYCLDYDENDTITKVYVYID